MRVRENERERERERTCCVRDLVLQHEIFMNCSSISKIALPQWTWWLFWEIEFQAFLPSSINFFAMIIWYLNDGEKYLSYKIGLGTKLTWYITSRRLRFNLSYSLTCDRWKNICSNIAIGSVIIPTIEDTKPVASLSDRQLGIQKETIIN